MASNVVIKTRVAAYNVDALNRTAVCASDIENGCIFKLTQYSTDESESMVWQAEQAAATDTDLWMATSPEVVIIRDSMGVEYKGLNQDPRAFVNYAGNMIDCIKLQKGDIIEMTAANINNADTMDYLVPDTTDFKLTGANAAGDGLCLHKIGTSMLHIGSSMMQNSHPVTYKYEVVNN